MALYSIRFKVKKTLFAQH